MVAVQLHVDTSWHGIKPRGYKLLTAREFKQLSDAIMAMRCYNINGQHYVDEHNVRVLLSNYVDEEVEVEIDDGQDQHDSAS